MREKFYRNGDFCAKSKSGTARGDIMKVCDIINSRQLFLLPYETRKKDIN